MAIGRALPADDAREAGQGFVGAVRQLQRSCGVPVALDVLRETDIPEIVDRVLTEVQGRYAVPRYMDAAECAEVLRGMLPARP